MNIFRKKNQRMILDLQTNGDVLDLRKGSKTHSPDEVEQAKGPNPIKVDDENCGD